MFINDILQFVVTVLYECDRYAELTALWGCVRGWGKRDEPQRRKGREGRKERNTCDTKFL
ncbi:MAG: hypothetical protein RMZ41_017905 [Nostoc sp. DedVER02]|uniref:hypothetical protein n=1 Tax=unclassified Nostoc TaxID=2593658 RepID=UPI002AD3DD6C|nr:MULTISPECIES: hypothetical protein [unclassified Nostoc]MDZ7985261.1 hypothetical protein [Nostoc sp. DedVER02]MDZ8115199.1 hypothetical protein [Nostoc sp. DedVER01b]